MSTAAPHHGRAATATGLTDARLLARFEAGTLDGESFGHADHVRLAWLLLQRMSLLETIATCSAGLRRLAAAAGHAERYHETVTWALLVLIHERIRTGPPATTWGGFAAAHPDLLRWRDGPLFDVYDGDVLASDVARRWFVLPKRVR